ncbi:polyprotein [Porcine pestivirus isolate Bungowannah]|uniref:Genome polyprotein n=7 Tax=Porcine pestivirus isolate Bungowannah TaxID=412969 RepID=D2CGF5_9FLAV|nr:polyprotein [Porcine pestivirus isolate Bungowannah]ABO21120.2 polyprotein [Porcine pestivirus isolate Bungowannah]
MNTFTFNTYGGSEEGNMFFRTAPTPPPGCQEPVYTSTMRPIFGEPHPPLHKHSTLKLPHWRGIKTIRVKKRELPKKGDCSNSTTAPTSGVYVELGAVFYKDYTGTVYHRVPLELCTNQERCEGSKCVGRMTGSDGRLYNVLVCPDDCILFERHCRGQTVVLKWISNPLTSPLWVQSCSDDKGAKPKVKPKDDRMKQGKIVTKPKETEADQKTRPPDATIVVDGQKYQVRKKGKAKPKTQDGLYHNKNKPEASRKKLEKALLAWAILACLLVVPVGSTNVTQWNLWDNKSTTDIHSVMFSRGIKRSLHGIWPTQICKGIPTHLAADYELKRIHGMVDASPMTNFTCCRLQRHEWNKHGWCNWYNIEPWINLMNNTQGLLNTGDNFTECAVTCRYDADLGVNIVTQARTTPTILTGCKKGHNFSFSGEVRASPCNFELTAEDLLRIMDHTNCEGFTYFGEGIVDGYTEVVEKARSSGFRALTWLSSKIENTKKKIFGAEASPYCPVAKRVFNIIYTNNCTPLGLPDKSKIIGPGTFDISGRDEFIFPKLPYHVDDFILLSLIAMSDFAPETSSIIYLALHYLMPSNDNRDFVMDLDPNKLNLTATKSVASVVPTSVNVLGEWVCVKPSWWPYSAEITNLIGGVITVADLVIKTIEELLNLWTEATAVAFLAALIKIFRGQPIQAVAWLIIIGGAQAQTCNPEFMYALAKNTSIGSLGPESLTTRWYQLTSGFKLTDSTIEVTCVGANMRIHVVCPLVSDRYLAINHPRALPTTAWFRKIHTQHEVPRERIMSESKRRYTCPCGSKPVVRSTTQFNPISISTPSFELECPRGWTGAVECTLVSPSTLTTETIFTYRKPKPFGLENWCKYTVVEKGILYSCKFGGNSTCIKGLIVKGQREDKVRYCEWCGYKFSSPNGLPQYPLGLCEKEQSEGLRDYGDFPCCNNGTCIDKEGSVQCYIGDKKVTVKLYNASLLAPMPCKPIVYNSQGPPAPKTCTYRWASTLENKYYEPRDSYYQQYIIKSGYQYWFDLTAKDHVADWITKYFPIIIVALLGGRGTLWVLIAYELLTQYEVVGDENIVAQAEALVIGNILMSLDLEIISCFLLLLIVVKKQAVRRTLALLFHWITMNPFQSVMITVVYFVGLVRAEEGTKEGSTSGPPIHVVAILLFLLYHTVKYKDFNIAMILLITLSLKSSSYIHTSLYEIPLLVAVISLTCSIYIFDLQVKSKLVAPTIGIIGVTLAMRVLWLVRQMTIPTPSVSISLIDPKMVIILYLISLTITVNHNLDLASYCLKLGPFILSFLTMWVDVVILLLMLPWYELVKVYYLKKKKEDVETWFQNSGISTQETSPYGFDFSSPGEGVHTLPMQNKTKFCRTAYMTVLRALVITAISSVWKPIILAELLIEAVYWTHIKIAKELAGSSRFVARFIASIIELNWAMDEKEASRYKRFYLLSSKITDLMVKHKIQNETVKSWFEETEIFGIQKVAMVIRAHSLSLEPNAILCSVCEEKQNQKAKRPCPKCGSRGTQIKCGLTLAEFEEEHYKKIYILEGQDETPMRKEERQQVTYVSRGALFLRNLPILASKNKYLLVGNLGMELQDLESMGWIIRGPAVCKKIIHHEKCRPSIPDKLMAFFGIMPRGVTPRAPTRFPVSLLKIRRGFETGWAYTHPGGVSSVMHVTAGSDIYVNDSIGRTKIQCQDKNTTTDECEYGVKTDSGCSDGARCYVINPEATNIAGTKGAMVHLRKAGGEFNCVTAQGTPAFYNLKNLKGWSGLPIFEAATGRVVGRVKAGKNTDNAPTTIMSGTQVAKPSECDLESVVRKLETMNRGEFKQVTLATGAGKTTMLPKLLIESIGRHKRVLVLIPLRAAAEGVYQYMRTKHPSISFNLRIGDLKEGDMATGITYASYGYFCQMDMPRLENAMKEYHYIFLDEYHCATPEQLAVMSKIHRFGESVRVIAMTATPSGTVSTTGQKFTIEEVVVPEVMKGEDLADDYIEIAGLKVPKKELEGNVLTFVPTRKMASETAKKLTTQGYNAGYYFSGEDPSSLRTTTSKSPYIVVATNAIESGVTLPDLDTVIDTGMKCEKRLRIENKAPYIVTGLKRMAITTGEQAQRKGRVGRVKPGRYLRGPENTAGEKDYHYDLLQAQRYGIQDSINITKSFREMNYDWALYEEDPLKIAQLELLNTLLISRDLPVVTKNLMARTTHPEPIQLAYNSLETPVPVAFPKVKNGEVTDAHETYELMTCRKLEKDPPIYLYATEEEDLVVDILGLKWPDATERAVLEVQDALGQITGLSAGETALLIALLGWVGYEALVKRHVPMVTDIYTLEDEKLEDTTHLQFAPDDLNNSDTIELQDLSNHQIQQILEGGKEYVGQAYQFLRLQAERAANSDKGKKAMAAAPLLAHKFLEYLQEHAGDIKKYGLWGVHTALYNSIKERLGHETAFASLVIKWIAFSSDGVPGMIKQAAVDLVVYYIINRPEYQGDKETQNAGRQFVGSLFVSCLAEYTFKNFNKSALEGLIEPALSYLPYASSALKLFLPTRLESVVILSTTIYRTYLSIRKGSSQGLAGLAVSSAMEIMNQNPISVAIALALGVGAIAAHNAIESSEAKRTLLMKVFVKNFLDQAATDELVKENPEKIIMAVFEGIQTAGNPLRLVYHLYAMFYKGWTAAEIAEKTAGRNIFVLTIFEGLEMLGLDADSKWRNLSSNYLIDAVKKIIEKMTKTATSFTYSFLKSLLPAPFSCTKSERDPRIGWPQKDYDYLEVRCACGYNRRAIKRDSGPVLWETLEETGPEYCHNRGERGLSNVKTTRCFVQGEEIPPIALRKGVGEMLVKGVSFRIDFDKDKILSTDKWKVPHRAVTSIFEDWQGIGYREAYLGTKPDYGGLVPRSCVTVTKQGLTFLKTARGMAFTTDLTIQNIKMLIATCFKNKVKEGEIPATIEGETWINIPLVNEDTGTIKPSFGERVIPEPYEEDPLEGPSVIVETGGIAINQIGVNPQSSTCGTVFTAVKDLCQTVSNKAKNIKIGFSEGQYPGPGVAKKTLNQLIQDEDPKPFIFVCGSDKSMSNRAKTARNIKRITTTTPEKFRDLAKNKKLIIVLLGDRYHEDIEKYADFKGTFLTRQTLEALASAKAVEKDMTKKEAARVLAMEEKDELELPGWLHTDAPKFLDITKDNITHHLIGDMQSLRERAGEIGAKATTQITKKGSVYTINLSTWWESERLASLEPLFRELLSKCRPVDRETYKNCHFATAAQLAGGNWVPVAPVVHLGEIPVKKKKTLPYEAYKLLKEMVDSEKEFHKPVSREKHQWILNKVKTGGDLGLKNLVCPGRVGEPILREKKKFNIYNKRITSTMLSVGIRPEKLPVVRAQTSTKEFHEAIRDKIDKKANTQTPGLHKELLEIFNSICAIPELRNTYKEVDWDVLTSGINRKGAAGYFEKMNIGEIIDSDKKSVEQLIKRMKSGLEFNYYETAIPKNEKRAVVDDWMEGDYVEEKRPRVIQYPEAKMRLAITKVMYNWVKQKPIVIPGYEGKTPLFHVFDKVHKEWKNFNSPVAVSFDTKAWDTQVTPKDLLLISEIQKYYYKKEYHRFIDNLTEKMVEVPVVCEDGNVYIREGQRGSGQPDTSAGNSMLNVLTMIYAFCKANSIPYSAFHRVAKIHVCGDDGFLITEKSFGEAFAIKGPQILMEAGKPQKLIGEFGLKLAYKFDDIEFCSHTPIKVRWADNNTSYMPGRDTATILAKMATRLDSSGERGTEGYELAVAFSFLLMYSWNPLVRRICLLVMSTIDTKEASQNNTIYTFRGDPIGAYTEVIGYRLDQLKQTEFSKLAQLNLSMAILQIYNKNTTKRLIEDCVKLGNQNKQILVNADRLISKKTGYTYEPTAGHTKIGKHYEEINLLKDTPQKTVYQGTERYVPGPIRDFILRRLKILEIVGLKF